MIKQGIFILAILTASCLTVSADDIKQRRAALLDLALSPADYEGKTADVRCPMISANTNGFSCVVVNSSLKDVGIIYVSSSRLPKDAKHQIVDRCTSRSTVTSECVANIRITVDGGLVQAQEIEWANVSE